MAKLDFEKLPVGSCVDYILFKRNLLNELRLLDIEAKEYTHIRQWIPFADTIYTIEKPRRRGAAVDAKQLALQLTNIQQQAAALPKKLPKDTALTIALSNRASTTVKNLQAALKNVFYFYNGYDLQFSR